MKPVRIVGAPVVLALLAAVGGCAQEPASEGASGGGCAAAAPGAQKAAVSAEAPLTVRTDATLPRVPLRDVVLAEPGDGAEVDDHGIVLGGVGSDIFPAEAPDEYWMITDRGPNGKVEGSAGEGRTFPVPSWDPTILRVKVAGDRLDILERVPITGPGGQGVTGLSNTLGRDEVAYDLRGEREIPVNPAGLDPEGLVRAPNGEFWVSEEYGPSIVRVSPRGTVLARYVPQGLDLPAAGYPVEPTLPAVLAKREVNRGFESLAISPDGRTLYAALQSPLALPDEEAGGASRAVRLLALDAATGRPTAEYVYPLEAVDGFDPGARGDQSAMKVSGLAWFGRDRLLVDERTDDVAKLYVVDVDPARNILGGPYDDPDNHPPLEQADLASSPVRPLAKTLLVDLSGQVPGLPRKIEGIAVRDPRTIVVANDNDFGMVDGKSAFDAAGRQCDTGVPSRLLVLELE